MPNLPLELWIALIAFGSAGILSWLLLTEGSYLGSGWVRRSYDWLAPWYEGKWKSEEYKSDELNQQLFIKPVLKAISGSDDGTVAPSTPCVLDLACGTGRASFLMLDEPTFEGHIDAIDFSAGMLRQFEDHLSQRSESERSRVTLSQLDLANWSCEQRESYDAVLFLEAAELVSNLPELLSQIRRSLKPTGVLITTRVGQRFKWLFPGRHQQDDALNQLLMKQGFEIITTSPWRKRYDVIIARPAPESNKLSEIRLVEDCTAMVLWHKLWS